MSGAAVPRTTARSLFAHRDFALMVASRVATLLGMQILVVAVGWHLYRMTGAVLYLGLVGLAQFLPVLVFFLVAGWAADRFDRGRIVGLCNGLHLVGAVLIGLFWLVDGDRAWILLLILTVHGTARVFLHTALQAALPRLVPREMFANAIAVTTSIGKIAQLAGPAVGGLLIAGFDTSAYFFAAGLFAVAAISAAMIGASLRSESAGTRGPGAILDGFRHIRRDKAVLGAITIDLVAVLMGGIMGLLPVFAIDVLHVGPEHLGLMRSAPAIGGLAVGLLLARFALPGRTGPWFFGSLSVFAAAILIFSLSSVFWLSLGALFVYGAADMISVYVRQTLVQIRTPDELRGRVSAVNSVAINASNELGDFRAGTMAAAIGTVPAVAAGALLTFGATLLWWRLFPDLRRLGPLQSA